jgi:chromosome segregation ATPase
MAEAVLLELPDDEDEPGPGAPAVDPQPAAEPAEEYLSQSEHDELVASLSLAHLQRINTVRAEREAARAALAPLQAQIAELKKELSAVSARLAAEEAAAEARVERDRGRAGRLAAIEEGLAEQERLRAEACAERDVSRSNEAVVKANHESLLARIAGACRPVLERHGLTDLPDDAEQLLALLSHAADVQRTAPAPALDRELAATREQMNAAIARRDAAIRERDTAIGEAQRLRGTRAADPA